MIRLRTINEKIQAVLTDPVTTNQLDVAVFYCDKGSNEIKGYANTVKTNDNNLITVTNPPLDGLIREIDSITIINVDTADAELSVYFVNNTSSYLLFRSILDVGDQAFYTSDEGWKVLDSTGSVKGVGTTGPPGPGTDLVVANITTTTLDVTSSSGADATLPSATQTDAGLMSASDKTYLDNLDAYIIAMGAAL